MTTDQELRDLSTHLTYEIEMLFATANVLEQHVAGTLGIDLPLVLANSLVESFVFHFRALQEFLWADKRQRKTDARAADYFEKGVRASLRPREDVTILDGPARAGRELAHITYLREDPAAPWRFAQIAASIGRCLRVFFDNVDQSKLPDCFIDRIRSGWPAFLNFPVAVSFPADDNPPGIATTMFAPPAS